MNAADDIPARSSNRGRVESRTVCTSNPASIYRARAYSSTFFAFFKMVAGNGCGSAIPRVIVRIGGVSDAGIALSFDMLVVGTAKKNLHEGLYSNFRIPSLCKFFLDF